MELNRENKVEYGNLFRRNWRTLPGFCLLVFLVLSGLFLSSCGDSRNRAELARRIAAEEGKAEDDARITELKAGIRAVDSDVEKTIEAVRKKADYWRLLGIKYMDYSMWGEAMNAFDEAVAITPDYAFLLYNRGLCAAQLSLSSVTDVERISLLGQAESSYRRALAVDPRHTPALYGLGILLVFELSRPGEAIPIIEEYIAIERSDMRARFLLARAFLDTGRANEALDVYEYISRNAKDGTDIDKADDLHARVLGGDYGV